MPRLRIYNLEIEGPVYDVWPPKTHTNIYGKNGDDKAMLLKNFAGRAFRRPLKEGECDSYLKLLNTYDDGFELALQSILCSSSFLYMFENPGVLNDYALASRLSYSLWETMPDQELLDLAKAGKLSDKKVLSNQIERMLKDKRSSSLTDSFMFQWLKLANISKMPPDQKSFSEFYKMRLNKRLITETKEFFRHLLDNNLSVSNFINSDFTFADSTLAKFYGINSKGLGSEFKKVSLKGVPHRGGLLGQGSVLTASANGVDTSPVIRGLWVLETVFNAPPPPPPAGVDTSPDARGAVTVRQILEKHSADPSCHRCHSKIDPLGLALENFDPIGRWRSKYEDGHDIDPSGTYRGIAFKNIDNLKKSLEGKTDLMAKSLMSKFLSYATGREMGVKDKLEIDGLVLDLEKKGYGMRDMFHAILTSKIFLER